MTPSIPRWLGAVLASAVLVAAVTAVLALLEPEVPALGLGVLYLLAVVPIAVIYGWAAASAVSLASMATFTYCFLPPRYSLDPGSSERWSVVVAFLVSALVVSQLAARSQREARRSARLADEQAALRRVAMLVARGDAPQEVFAAVGREVGLLLGVDATYMARYESDDTATLLATWRPDGKQMPTGTRADLMDEGVARLVFPTDQPARSNGGEPASVSAPILVDERRWGLVIASAKRDGSLPADAESRIAAFTELVATAIANVESRAGLARLAEEQAALRRLATLVARGTPTEEVFAAVVDEVGRLLSLDLASLARYEPDGTLSFVAAWGKSRDHFPAGTRRKLGGNNLGTIVFETGRAARIDNYAESSSGPIGAAAHDAGINSSLASPITIEGRLWGVIAAGSTRNQPLPPDTEARLASFTELVATAIANSEARTELSASRARIVAATDDERRRVVRDLHDGAQQRLVHTIVTLKLAQRALQDEDPELPALLTEALDNAQQANVELRDLAHGILPPALTQGGLRAGVDALASRMPVPVEIDVSVGRLPAAVEATAYFVVAEALTNVVKHARARHVAVAARIEQGRLAVEVRDDGVGGVQTDGRGLLGLADRVASLDGELRVESPAAGGTLVAAVIPSPAVPTPAGSDATRG